MTAEAPVVSSCLAYFGLDRKLTCPGPASSRAATDVTDTELSPLTSAPIAAASSFNVMANCSPCPRPRGFYGISPCWNTAPHTKHLHFRPHFPLARHPGERAGMRVFSNRPLAFSIALTTALHRAQYADVPFRRDHSQPSP